MVITYTQSVLREVDKAVLHLLADHTTFQDQAK